MDDYSDDFPFWDVVDTRDGPTPLVIVPYAIDTNDMKMWTDPAMKEPNKFTEYFLNKDIFGMLLQVKDEINPVSIGEKTPQVIDKVKSTVMIQALQQKVKTPAAALKESADQTR